MKHDTFISTVSIGFVVAWACSVVVGLAMTGGLFYLLYLCVMWLTQQTL